MIQNKTILLISPEAWGGNFVSKHHYANYLSKNNTVYFLNPAASFTKNPFGNVSCKTRVVQHGLIIVNYVNLLPRLNEFPRWIQANTYKRQAAQLQLALGIEKFDLIWSFDPNRYFDQRVWNADKRIYHTVDFHPNTKFEKDIILSSDLFLGVAPVIIENLKSIREGIVVPHAADIDGFHTEKVTLPGTNAIKAVYTGNFHRHINYGLLKNLVEKHKDVDFIMIGPVGTSNLSSREKIENEAFETLNAYANIYFIGSIKSNLLMSYLSACDINLVLFKKEFELIHCSPHKLMAYFYSGNITLSNYIDAHKVTNADIMLMCNSDLEILTAFELIKSNLEHYNSLDLIEKRRAYAEANSYKNRLAEIETYLYHS